MKKISLLTLFLVFSVSVARAQTAAPAPDPSNQDSDDATEARGKIDVDTPIAEEVVAPAEEKVKIAAEEKAAEAKQKALDDAPFVATLDNPLPPEEEYTTPVYETAVVLQPHDVPLRILPFKSAKASGFKIAPFKRPFEKAGKDTTETAVKMKHLESGFCGKPAETTDHVVKPCFTKEIR
jgi:hypothetical protein